MKIANLIACPDCRASVSRKAYSCPHCGRKIRSMPVNILAAAILGAIVFCIFAPIVVSFFGQAFRQIALPARQSDDELKQRMEERSRDAYLNQLEEAQKAKRKRANERPVSSDCGSAENKSAK
jgi:hypothetical protein